MTHVQNYMYIEQASMYFMIKMVELYKSISLIYHLVIVYFFLLFIISTLDLLDTIKMNWIITNYYQLLLIITNLKEKGHSVNQKLSFFFFQTKKQLSRFWHSIYIKLHINLQKWWLVYCKTRKFMPTLIFGPPCPYCLWANFKHGYFRTASYISY